MKRSSYRNRDYDFAQAMATLRSAMGLTQAGLAEVLGVSRYAVRDWEAGDKYPKAEHLKRLIVLAAEHRALPVNTGASEIRALWHLAHQKVLLDEHWLAALVSQFVRMEPVVEARPVSPHATALRQDWGEALSVTDFYGRESELRLLRQWVLDEDCRVIGVLGQGGIGKSALSARLMRDVAERFDVVIWRSLRDAPSCAALLEGCLQVLAPQIEAQTTPDFDGRLRRLLDYLRTQRTLLILDNLEAILEEGEDAGRMRPGYEDYDRLLRTVGETAHQSCLLFTSREKPIQLGPLEGSRSFVRVLRLTPLEFRPCELLLTDKGLRGTDRERARLIEAYDGNPLALKIVARTIFDLFDGEIAPFLDQGEIIFGSIRVLLTEQFARLTALEQTILVWLAILREPTSLDDLLAVMVTSVPRARLMEAMESLHRRSLVERGQRRGSFTLQSVVLEYGTGRIIAAASVELQTGEFRHLLEYGLVLAHANEHVRQTQLRLLAAPIIALLYSLYGHQTEIERRLRSLLTQMASLGDSAQGYGPANLVTLLRTLRGDLRGLDLSRLTLRGAHLQGAAMQDSSLAGALLHDSSFTVPFDVMKAIAISSSGSYWAGSGRQGEVWLWEAGGLNLRRVWVAQADTVPAVAFSPDERFLATCGGWDSTVRLWDVVSGKLLWTGQHGNRVNGVIFSPDGGWLASTSNDATVRLWDTRTGRELQVLAHPEPVCGAAWSPNRQMLASGDFEGRIRLWTVAETGEATATRVFVGHPKWAEALAFSPDGSTLATAGWERSVKLWDVASGRLLQSLEGHTDRVSRVVWSPDGRIIATGGQDKAIWLWDVEVDNYRAALQGHTGGVIGLAFTGDSHHLLSTSEDGTLRLWNAQNRQCIRVITGYTDAVYDVDWSPDGTQLASASTDALVTIWDLAGKKPPLALRGHNRVVSTVAWSPDGKQLASSEWDLAIRLWDPLTGAPLGVWQYPDDVDNFFYSIAWSPDGTRLASGSYRHGIQLINTVTGDHLWSGQPFPVWMGIIAWSPDGTQIAAGGENGTVYLWDAADGALRQQLTGHKGIINKVLWSADSRLLASGGGSGEQGELFLWDIPQGARLATFAGHAGLIDGLSWGASPDILISGDSLGTLRWWNIVSGALVMERRGHHGMVKSLKRHPNGSWLASCGEDGAIMIWDLSSGEQLQTIRHDRPYERLNITGIHGLTEAQKAILRDLGAVER